LARLEPFPAKRKGVIGPEAARPESVLICHPVEILGNATEYFGI